MPNDSRFLQPGGITCLPRITWRQNESFSHRGRRVIIHHQPKGTQTTPPGNAIGHGYRYRLMLFRLHLPCHGVRLSSSRSGVARGPMSGRGACGMATWRSKADHRSIGRAKDVEHWTLHVFGRCSTRTHIIFGPGNGCLRPKSGPGRPNACC